MNYKDSKIVIKHELLKIAFRLEIPAGHLIDMHRYDSWADVPLYLRLSEVPGVVDVDYDAHFGPYIDITIASGYKVSQTIEKLENYLKLHLQEYWDADAARNIY